MNSPMSDRDSSSINIEPIRGIPATSSRLTQTAVVE
jgi:hypothetical protein